MRAVLILAFLVAGCGQDGKDGEPCTVNDLGGGQKRISCPDGTAITVSDGVDGTSNVIEASVLCQGELLGTGGLHFVYRGVEFTSGDLLVYGAIRDDFSETGASAFFASTQLGAQTAMVIFTADYAATANAGWWDMSLGAGYTIAINYNDDDVSGGVQSWTFPGSACATTP